MNRSETITLTRAEYDALVARNDELEDRLAAVDGSRIPHEVALAIMRGQGPIRAFRDHLGFTLRDLSKRTGISASHLSEIERGLKPASASALSRVADALGATVDALISAQK